MKKVREIEVLKAAKDDSKNATLVYASEKAISYQVEDLPSQLRVTYVLIYPSFFLLTVFRILFGEIT